jgi:Apea-like HEPN
MNDEEQAAAIRLHEMCMRWLRAALGLLRSKSVMVAPDYDIAFTGEGYSATLGPNRADLGQTADAYAGNLSSQAEFLDLGNLIFGTPALAAGIVPGGTPSSAVTQDKLPALWRVCRTFPLEYVTLTNTLSFDEPTFERVCAQVQEYIFRPGPFESEWLFHLSNLSLEPNRVDLGDQLALRQVPPDERVWLIKQFMRTPRTGPFADNVLAVLAVLECKDMAAKWASAYQLTGPLLSTANTAVLALRLLKAQPVGLSGYHWQPVDQPLLFPRHYTPLDFNRPPMAYLGERYVLTSSDADALAALWPRVRRALTDDLLKIALTRLEDSYHRTKDEDRLIDYWTALESLFLPDDRRIQDMGETVAMVVAHYLGRNVSERNSIRNDITRSHTLRSHIVHGKRSTPAHDMAEMVTKTGDHLRRALRKRIQE